MNRDSKMLSGLACDEQPQKMDHYSLRSNHLKLSSRARNRFEITYVLFVLFIGVVPDNYINELRYIYVKAKDWLREELGHFLPVC